ncbi:hypothetical protein ACFLTM_01715 [Candidatus Bipolaricaulota bacterium]
MAPVDSSTASSFFGSTTEWVMVAGAVIGVSAAVLGLAVQQRRLRRATENVQEAEREAFQEKPQEIEARLRELADSQEGLEQRASELGAVLEESRNLVQTGRLLSLYSKQIEKYQLQTRSRASWSFFVALVAMFAGLVFLVWGGTVLFSAKDSVVLAAGGLISAAGGAVSAYIAKTFLDMHRVSVGQLNRYFRQPVVNDRVLMAQRLADELDDPEARRQAYDKIITSLTDLIKLEHSDS